MSTRLAKRLFRLEQPAARVCNSTKNSDVLRLLKEIREVKAKLKTQKPKGVLSGSSNLQERRLGDAEICIKVLQNVCCYTRGFDPWKVWQLKTVHDMVMDLVQSKVPPDEIARRMTLRTSGGRDLDLVERLFGTRWAEDLQGRGKEFAVFTARTMRQSLGNYPSTLEQIDRALAESLGETAVDQAIPIQYHLVGELSGPGCLNSPFCSS